jgi:hypothetical protein
LGDQPSASLVRLPARDETSSAAPRGSLPTQDLLAGDILGGEPLGELYDRLRESHGLSSAESLGLLQGAVTNATSQAAANIRQNVVMGVLAAGAGVLLIVVISAVVQESAPADGKEHTYYIPFAGAPLFYSFYVFRRAWRWRSVRRSLQSMQATIVAAIEDAVS